MAFPYGRTQGQYTPLGGGDPNVIYQSPQSISGQWGSANNATPPNLGSPPLEMYGRPNAAHRQSGGSFQSFGAVPPLPERPGAYPLQNHGGGNSGSMDSQATVLPRPHDGRWSMHSMESETFLNEPMNKLDTSFSSETYHTYKDRTGTQLLHLLWGSALRFFVTAGLCASYILSVKLWQKKSVIDEQHKKLFNAVTTGISLALGLNIASSFKDLALNMRWPILSARRRNLKELDLILNADSLGRLFKLVFITRRPWVIISCLAWLLINIAAQAGIAMLNLTYGFDVNYSAVLFSNPQGNVSVPDMSHFYPNGDNFDPGIHDEEYTANLYGGLVIYGWNDTKYMPKPRDIYKGSNAMLWSYENEPAFEFMFTDAPAKTNTDQTFSSYSDRRVKVTYACESHEVVGQVNDNSTEITVSNIGKVKVNKLVSTNATNYFTDRENTCGEGNSRCSVVESFENSDNGQWYYKCNIELGLTQNDPRNLSYISDAMASTATSAIAQMGYSQGPGPQTQVYPRKSLWGTPVEGDADFMGYIVAMYALGSIAGASLFNPKIYYQGVAPIQGYELNLNHPKFFYLIIGLICGCQLVFIIIVAILSNRVKVGPNTYLLMALLLRPIADALEGVSGGNTSKKNKAYDKAKKMTTVRYEKDGRNGRWHLKMLAK